jgi:hypothetical protein
MLQDLMGDGSTIKVDSKSITGIQTTMKLNPIPRQYSIPVSD